MKDKANCSRSHSRRAFLLGSTAGLFAGSGLGWYASGLLSDQGNSTLAGLFPGRTKQTSAPTPTLAMPGRYPGRVIEVHHPKSVSASHEINRSAVDAMVNRGMAELTGYEPGDELNAWKSFFEKDDVVGIKVNPVGKKPGSGEGRTSSIVGCISSFELLEKVVRCLRQVGIPSGNIIVFERYASEFCEAGYKDFVESELPGVRWMCAAAGYSGQQLDIKGKDPDSPVMAPEVDRNITGYDPDVFTTMGYCLPSHSPRDDRRYRSHLSMIVSRYINKMINLPVLKDHRSAGVTLCLKNMSHGMNNNVARSHLSGHAHGIGLPEKVLGPNQCNTFIPQAVSQMRLREKATLHILDGLIGVYEGGPGNWNRTWGTWRRRSLFFATDPVALDHVGWDIIDAKRAELGWEPVARMGLLHQTPQTPYFSAASTLAFRQSLQTANMEAAAMHLMEGRSSEVFNLRQPDHIILAGQLGLGVFERELITYRKIDLPV